MATLESLEYRIESVDDAVKLMTKTYASLSNIMANQGFQLAELRYQTAELRQQTAELRQQTADIKEQTAEIKRDCQQNRRLWIAIARKLDWLDLDEDFD